MSEALVETCKTHWTQKKRMELDGIRYEICAFESADATFRATWACGECQEKGAWVPISADAQEIMRQAEIGVRVHHALVHGDAFD
jgi:hypothetical protein